MKFKSFFIYSLLSVFLFTDIVFAQTSDPLTDHININVRPQDDFFEYANGAWFSANPIPPSEQSNGIFDMLEDTIEAQVFEICRSAAAGQYPFGSPLQKIGDLYYSAMDSAALNSRGWVEILPDLQRIAQTSDLTAFVRTLVFVSLNSQRPVFRFGVYQDTRSSDRNAFYLGQGGLSLPDRRYYVETDEESENIRKAFLRYITDVFSMAGYSDADAKRAAADILDLETQLAKAARKREDTRDPIANYNKMSFSQLQELTTNFYWKDFFAELHVPAPDSVIVGQPEFFSALNGMLNRVPMKVWAEYLAFHFVDGLSHALDDKLYAARFNFYGKIINGVEQPRPRWKRAVDEVNDNLGDLVGQIYVEKYLPKGTKEKLIEIGTHIKAEFVERIKKLDWMSDETKYQALEKLGAVKMKLAWPDKWKDLSSLRIDRGSYVRNVRSIQQWQLRENLSRLQKPVDRDEWHMYPQTYNAYYSPVNNEICIPGCNILVPGYEDRMPDDAILYGIVGGTFGHELSHGFDDTGCRFDKDGNLRDWWTKRDKERFDRRTRQIVRQFDAYEPFPGLHINGSLTQGENIADLAGVILALQAYKKTPQYVKGEKISGFTPLQRFFLGYALTWMWQMRPEALKRQVKSNEHAPAKWRVNGPLSNIDDFYEAFSLKKGDGMWRKPKDRVRIW